MDRQRGATALRTSHSAELVASRGMGHPSAGTVNQHCTEKDCVYSCAAVRQSVLGTKETKGKDEKTRSMHDFRPSDSEICKRG